MKTQNGRGQGTSELALSFLRGEGAGTRRPRWKEGLTPAQRVGEAAPAWGWHRVLPTPIPEPSVPGGQEGFTLVASQESKFPGLEGTRRTRQPQRGDAGMAAPPPPTGRPRNQACAERTAVSPVSRLLPHCRWGDGGEEHSGNGANPCWGLYPRSLGSTPPPPPTPLSGCPCLGTADPF